MLLIPFVQFISVNLTYVGLIVSNPVLTFLYIFFKTYNFHPASLFYRQFLFLYIHLIFLYFLKSQSSFQSVKSGHLILVAFFLYPCQSSPSFPRPLLFKFPLVFQSTSTIHSLRFLHDFLPGSRFSFNLTKIASFFSVSRTHHLSSLLHGK